MNAPLVRYFALFALVFSQFLFSCMPVMAGPGHDHGHGPELDASSQGPNYPRLTMTSDAYELVGILEDHKLKVYLDQRQTISPVTDAKVKFTIDGATLHAKPQSDGTYFIEDELFNQHKTFEIVAEIEHDTANDLLVGTLDTTHAPEASGGPDPFGHDHAIHHQGEGEGAVVDASSSILSRIFSGSLFVAFAVGCGFGLALSFVLNLARRSSTLNVALYLALVPVATSMVLVSPGHAHSDHDHGQTAQDHNRLGSDVPGRMADNLIFLPKPTQRLLELRTQIVKPKTAQRSERLIGRVIANPNRNGLVQSTIKGRIVAPAAGLPVLGQRVVTGQQLAMVEPAFAPIDASDVRQTAGDLEQRIAVTEARLARRRQLVQRNVASRASLEDLELELDGLKARRKQLDVSRSKPETLVSPVSGVIAEVRAAVGQVVESSDTLFHIVDPESLWVEALAFDTKLSLEKRATAYTDEGTPLDLTFVGRSRALQQQAVILQYRIHSPPKSLSIGSPLSINVDTGQTVEGIILPKEAVAEAPNGQTVAYVRVSPERYRSVPLRTENLDSKRLLVRAGLKSGDQVIIRGASLVSQIR